MQPAPLQACSLYGFGMLWPPLTLLSLCSPIRLFLNFSGALNYTVGALVPLQKELQRP